jgi:hypothetical protein
MSIITHYTWALLPTLPPDPLSRLRIITALTRRAWLLIAATLKGQFIVTAANDGTVRLF